MAGTCDAPWTDEQVAAITRWQEAGYVHELTCGNDSRHRALVAENAGLRCLDCDYTQNWVPEIVMHLWPNPLERTRGGGV